MVANNFLKSPKGNSVKIKESKSSALLSEIFLYHVISQRLE